MGTRSMFKGFTRSGIVVALVAASALGLSACSGGEGSASRPSPSSSPSVQSVPAVNAAGSFVGPAQKNPSGAAATYFAGLGEAHVPTANVLASMGHVEINADDPSMSKAQNVAVAQSVVRQLFLAEFFSYYPAVGGLGGVETEGAVGQTQWSAVAGSPPQSFNESGTGCLFPYRLSVVPLADTLVQVNDTGGPDDVVVAWWRYSKGCKIVIGGKVTGTGSAGSMQQVLFLNTDQITKAIAQYVGGPVVQQWAEYTCGASKSSIVDASQIESSACAGVGAS